MVERAAGASGKRTRMGPAAAGAWLLVAALAGPPPAAAAIDVVSSSAQTSVQAMSGVFDFAFASPVVDLAPPGFTAFESDQTAAPFGPFPASAHATQQASIAADGSSVFATASGFAQSVAPLVDEPPLSNLIANAVTTFSLAVSASGPASFSIAAQVTGLSPGSAVSVSCTDGSGPIASVENQRSASVSGRISAGGLCNVSVLVNTQRNGNRDFLNPGEDTGTFQLSFAMTDLPPEGDEFTWIGGTSGDFGNPNNWSPTGVPTSGDTANFSQGGSATVGLANALAARNAFPRGPVEVLLERTRVNLDPVQPQAGVLRLLSPALDDPSLVVNSGGVLLLDSGSLTAQTAVIGEDGLGTVNVSGANLFQTDGRLVIGRDGEGRLNLAGGGNALSDEVVMGEGSGPGNAIVAGNGSLWIASRLHVSRPEPSTVQVFSGGELDTTEAVVDRAPQGELPNVTIDQDSKWLVDRLRIEGRGVVECTGGTIDPRSPGTPGEIAIGTSSPGVGRLLASEGCRIHTEGDLQVARQGNGRLTVDGTNQQTSVRVDGTLRVGGTSFDFGKVVLSSSLVTQTNNLLAGTLELHGDMLLEHAARASIAGNALIDDGPGLFGGRLELRGNGPPELTRLEVGSNTRVGDRGFVKLTNATLASSTLDIDPGGRLVAEGDGNVLDVLSGILNNGVLSGRIRLAAGTFVSSQSTGVLELVQSGAPPAPALSPLAAVRFPRSLRAPAQPPVPLGGLLEFEGDGELGGKLVLQFQNGFAPRAGEAIEVVRAGGALSGAFSEVEVRGLAPGAQFDTGTDGGGLQLVAVSDTLALPSVSLAAKPILKEKKKGGLKVKVLRTGDTSAPLFVSYAIGGSARNGIDYETLSGIVEIPARRKSAKIAVRPFAEGLLEEPETIELEVLPGANYTPSLLSKLTIDLESQDGVAKKKRKRR